MRLAAEALRLRSARWLAPQLGLPVKLLVPQQLGASKGPLLMLGLGDVALPAMLLALLLATDYRRAAKQGGGGGGSGVLPAPPSWGLWRGGYTAPVWLGYCVGLVAAFAAGLVFQAPQPAMVYIVPAMLAPTLAAAVARGELGELWSGRRLAAAAGKELDV